MALSKSALSELLDALRAGGDLDVIREGLAVVLQALIDAEAAQHIGADRYERTQQRTAHRNGTRPRLLSTKAGDVELQAATEGESREPLVLVGATGFEPVTPSVSDPTSPRRPERRMV